ncbi:hypothetical protein [Ectopseudomonas mendocina]|uniref:hypothetical protein n=1 Tax=Ectopseudomonas mendocina TaxID=300 RepID=UPI0011D1848D|nr:hypothetical protein [Pseudomonas mendocina]
MKHSSARAEQEGAVREPARLKLCLVAMSGYAVALGGVWVSLCALQVSDPSSCLIKTAKESVLMIALGFSVTLASSGIWYFPVSQGQHFISIEVRQTLDKSVAFYGEALRGVYMESSSKCCATVGDEHVIRQPIRVISSTPRLRL